MISVGVIIINALVDKYTKDELSEIVSNSFSMKEVVEKLNYSTAHGSNYITVKKRIDEYGISINHFKSTNPVKRTEDNVFCKNSTASQITLRRWYKKISDNSKCKICGQSSLWNGKELTMILDHTNGDHRDNRKENLRWICPNCNSQLDTFAGRNNAKK